MSLFFYLVEVQVSYTVQVHDEMRHYSDTRWFYKMTTFEHLYIHTFTNMMETRTWWKHSFVTYTHSRTWWRHGHDGSTDMGSVRWFYMTWEAGDDSIWWQHSNICTSCTHLLTGLIDHLLPYIFVYSCFRFFCLLFAGEERDFFLRGWAPLHFLRL